MVLSQRLRDLDDRVLRDRPNAAHEEWGRRHAWWLLAALGCLLVAFGLWALSTDRPAMAGVPTSFGVGALGLAVYLFLKRPSGQAPR